MDGETGLLADGGSAGDSEQPDVPVAPDAAMGAGTGSESPVGTISNAESAQALAQVTSQAAMSAGTEPKPPLDEDLNSRSGHRTHEARPCTESANSVCGLPLETPAKRPHGRLISPPSKSARKMPLLPKRELESAADKASTSSVLASGDLGTAPEGNECRNNAEASEQTVMTPEQAEKERMRRYGGWPLHGTINVLGTIQSQVTPATMNQLYEAIMSDVESWGIFLPKNPVAGGAHEAAELEDAHTQDPPLSAGDTLDGQVSQSQVQIRLFGEGESLSARVFVLIGGDWIRYDAHVQMLRDPIGSKLPSWNIHFEGDSSSARLPMEFRIFQGRLSAAGVQVAGNGFGISRSRAHIAPESQWRAATQTIDSQCNSCEPSFECVRKAKELKSNIKQFKEWREELDVLASRLASAKKEERFVLFVGASGVGKSKLINQLLGEDVLPSEGAGSAVTAAPIELYFRAVEASSVDAAPGSALLSKRYHVEFELFSLQEFTKMRNHATERLLEYWEYTERDTIPAAKPPVQDDAREARHAHDWFEAVYGSRAFPKDHEWADKDEFCKAFAELPQKLQRKTPSNFNIKSAAELEQRLRQWLVADEKHRTQPQTWPLVKSARVRGPWQVLASGIVFVDLPGVGDSNAVRNEIAAREWKRADFACICSRIDRAVTDKESMEWLDKAVRDLRAKSIAYVCTKADDVSREEVMRKKGRKKTLPGTKAQAACERNEQVKKSVRLKHPVPVYTVSARDYARCIGLDCAAPETFHNVADTEVPKLLTDICDAVLARRARQRVLLLESMVAKLKVMESQLAQCPEADFDVEKIRKSFDASVSELDSKLKSCCAASLDKLSKYRSAVDLSCQAGAAESKQRLGSQANHYGRGTNLHWRRHKKLVDTNGEWLNIDISADISGPMLEKTDPNWIKAFEAMPSVADELCKQLLSKSSAFVSNFSKKFSKWPEVQTHIKTIGETQAEAVETMLKEHKEDLEERLVESRKGYADEVKTAVKRELSQQLLDAQMSYSGRGSFALRKESVSVRMPRMTLEAPASAPKRRLNDVTQQFREVGESMAEASRTQFEECYARFLQAHEQNKRDEATRKALREMIQCQLCCFQDPLARARSALPE